MIFRRSTSALFSMHIFFRVDSVVFCEGGAPMTYGEAAQPVDTGGTLDTQYWASVVNTYGLQKTFHFKSVGGKETIGAIAEEVHRHNITSITVCRDSDYDALLASSLPGDRIAWTFGYSWENDVVRLPVLEKIAEALVGPGPNSAQMVRDLRDKVSRFSADLQRWTEIDISLSARQRGCLFDREKPLSAIDMDAPPNLRTEFLQQRLANAGYKRRPARVVPVHIQEAPTRCYGKLVGRALYQTFIAELRKYIDARLSYELFMRLAISETIRALAAGLLPDFATHVGLQRAAFA